MSINITYHPNKVSEKSRASHKNQVPHTFWFTGLSGAGKSSLANIFEQYLIEQGKHTMLLDGDNIRFGLNNNLSFSTEDRKENIRRIAEVTKLMNQAGLIVIVATISPTQQDRDIAREIIGKDLFSEIYISTSLQECEKRDIKGLYKKARNGEITNFTGIQQTYEPPQNPDAQIDTAQKKEQQALDELIEQVKHLILP